MRTQSIDTDPKAEEVQISLFRKATITYKFYKILSLSQSVLQLSRRAIARNNKNLTEKQIDILFVTYNYGEELAENLSNYLDKTDHENS